MIKRNEKGKLTINNFDMGMYFYDLFAACKNDSEVEWLYDRLESGLERARDEVLEVMAEDKM